MNSCQVKIIDWNLKMFKCDKCGKCCRHLNLSPMFSDLDRGDGICKYLNGNLCSIYDQRPLKCRVDDSYYVFFKNQMTLKEYYHLNNEMCKIIKSMED